MPCRATGSAAMVVQICGPGPRLASPLDAIGRPREVPAGQDGVGHRPARQGEPAHVAGGREQQAGSGGCGQALRTDDHHAGGSAQAGPDRELAEGDQRDQQGDRIEDGRVDAGGPQEQPVARHLGEDGDEDPSDEPVAPVEGPRDGQALREPASLRDGEGGAGRRSTLRSGRCTGAAPATQAERADEREGRERSQRQPRPRGSAARRRRGRARAGCRGGRSAGGPRCGPRLPVRRSRRCQDCRSPRRGTAGVGPPSRPRPAR